MPSGSLDCKQLGGAIFVLGGTISSLLRQGETCSLSVDHFQFTPDMCADQCGLDTICLLDMAMHCRLLEAVKMDLTVERHQVQSTTDLAMRLSRAHTLCKSCQSLQHQKGTGSPGA